MCCTWMCMWSVSGVCLLCVCVLGGAAACGRCGLVVLITVLELGLLSGTGSRHHTTGGQAKVSEALTEGRDGRGRVSAGGVRVQLFA